MLTIDLVRHGRALPTSPTGESGRLLTSEGEAQVRELADALAVRGFRPDRIFASPLARARQTAGLLGAAAAAPVEPETLVELTPDYPALEVLQALSSAGAGSGHVVLVGHMPQLGLLLALLANVEAAFTPGMLRRIDCPDGPRPGRGEVVLELPRSI